MHIYDRIIGATQVWWDGKHGKVLLGTGDRRRIAENQSVGDFRIGDKSAASANSLQIPLLRCLLTAQLFWCGVQTKFGHRLGETVESNLFNVSLRTHGSGSSVISETGA